MFNIAAGGTGEEDITVGANLNLPYHPHQQLSAGAQDGLETGHGGSSRHSNTAGIIEIIEILITHSEWRQISFEWREKMKLL